MLMRGFWLVSDSVPKPRLYESAVFLRPRSSTGKHHPQRAEVSRVDHHFWDDNGRLPRVEEAPLALCGDWWSPPVEKQELQTSGRTETHEPGQSISFFMTTWSRVCQWTLCLSERVWKVSAKKTKSSTVFGSNIYLWNYTEQCMHIQWCDQGQKNHSYLVNILDNVLYSQYVSVVMAVLFFIFFK